MSSRKDKTIGSTGAFGQEHQGNADDESRHSRKREWAHDGYGYHDRQNNSEHNDDQRRFRRRIPRRSDHHDGDVDADGDALDEFGRVLKKKIKDSSKSISLDKMSEKEQMEALLGIGGFSSTKGTLADGNDRGAARGTIAATGKREYRQYMNRRNGFNQKLAKVAQTKKLMK